MPDRVNERVPERMPGGVPERMPDGVPERIHVPSHLRLATKVIATKRPLGRQNYYKYNIGKLLM